MFNTTVVSNHQTVNKVVMPKPQQDITINRKEQGTVFVHFKKNDDIWKGLFYETPFLNRSDSSRGRFWAVDFAEWNPHLLAPYEAPHYLSDKEKEKQSKLHDENEEKILRIQAVEIIQLRMIGNNEVIAELKYLNPPER